jgi:YHS domain-containing protein
VAILARILQFIVWLIVATWLGRKLLGWLFGSPNSVSRPASTPAPQQLHRDPLCGTFVSPDISFPLEHSGRLHHFCSAECRERFVQAQRAAGRAGASA